MFEEFEHRIHVNGIRGKSSVTRLIAAALREGKVKTLGKTTGTAARILVNHRKDIVVPRKEADIVEQKRILDSYRNAGYKAVVFECMAIITSPGSR
jgi:UDP-N-acetylmuramoylalanine-D-glutamate ligase